MPNCRVATLSVASRLLERELVALVFCCAGLSASTAFAVSGGAAIRTGRLDEIRSQIWEMRQGLPDSPPDPIGVVAAVEPAITGMRMELDEYYTIVSLAFI